MLDLDKLTDAMVSHTVKAVSAATAPILARLEAVERRFDALPVVRDGKDADADEVAAKVREQIQPELDEIREAIPEAPELPDIVKMVTEAVEEAVKAIPTPQDGKDGMSVTVGDVMPDLEKRVDEFLATIQAPKDGRDGIDGKDGAPGDKGEPGRDGLDVKDLFRADGGRLVAVMSDGTTKDLGQFVGEDGAPGRDGADGKDGADGLGFEDMEFADDEAGRPIAKFQRGDVVKSVRLPCIVDCGPYKSGESYEKGDAVSYGGSLWIAQEPTAEKPDGGKGWRLAVKRGRDARGA